MARPSPQTHAKRQREQAKRDKRRAKDARRAERKAAKEAAVAPVTGGSSDHEPAADPAAEGMPKADPPKA